MSYFIGFIKFLLLEFSLSNNKIFNIKETEMFEKKAFSYSFVIL